MILPDAATCAMTAAAIAPLAAEDPRLHASLTMVLTFVIGSFCIGASFLRLGALADVLSKPILVGYLTGVALTIVLGQIGRVTLAVSGSAFALSSGGGDRTRRCVLHGADPLRAACCTRRGVDRIVLSSFDVRASARSCASIAAISSWPS